MPPRRTRRSCSRSTGSSSWSPRSRPPPSRSFSSASSPAARSAAPRPRATRRARDDGCRSAGPLPRPFDAGGRRGGAPGPDADGARAGDPDRARPERRRQDLVPAHRGRARRAVGGGEARARELLGRVGLEAKSSSLPGRLSGGEQQRVALCAALAHRPRLLLADEPTGELDAVNARVVYDAIAELARAERRRAARAAGGGETVASVRSLAKTHGTGATAAQVFDGFDASFESARLTAVTGPSGSGKTTLLLLLAGLDMPDAGEIEICGTVLNGLDRAGRAELRRKLLALVAQQPGLIPFLSARENVELTAAVRGLSADGDVLAAVGLAERAGQRVSRLSAGEQVRVAVARALAAEPKLLLVDEPTARLDQANARTLAVLLSALARETGAAVVCATHDPVVIEHADAELSLA